MNKKGHPMKPIAILMLLLISCGGGSSAPPASPASPAPPPVAEVTEVLCFGTSLTYNGTGIAAMIGAHETEMNIWVRNRGFGGHTSLMLLDHLAEAVSYKAPVVLIEAVMNDASELPELHLPLEDSRVYVTAIVEAFKATGARVYLMTTNPEIHEPTRHPDLEAYYQMVREVAAETGVTLLDFYPLWMRYSYGELHEMIPDHCHPTNEALEEVVLSELKNAIGGM